jgi:hypothetical protein
VDASRRMCVRRAPGEIAVQVRNREPLEEQRTLPDPWWRSATRNESERMERLEGEPGRRPGYPDGSPHRMSLEHGPTGPWPWWSDPPEGARTDRGRTGVGRAVLRTPTRFVSVRPEAQHCEHPARARVPTRAGGPYGLPEPAGCSNRLMSHGGSRAPVREPCTPTGTPEGWWRTRTYPNDVLHARGVKHPSAITGP